MTQPILHSSGEEFFFADEGCHITELSNHGEDPNVSVARARVEAGHTTRWHRLKGATERYIILAGEGVVSVGDHPPRSVTAGDTVVIPPNERQRIRNTGCDDLIFLAVCTPRFQQENYLTAE